jgi:hypothetical protein
MSAQSWKDEFYPVEAIAAVGSWTEAAQHSLRKWTAKSRKESVTGYGR